MTVCDIWVLVKIMYLTFMFKHRIFLLQAKVLKC